MMPSPSSRLVAIFVISWPCWLVAAAVLVASAAAPIRIVLVILSAVWIAMVFATIALSVTFRPHYQKACGFESAQQLQPKYNRTLGKYPHHASDRDGGVSGVVLGLLVP